jgi:PilZ domain-containing protein
MQDNRSSPRIPTRLKARLLSVDGRCNLNCVVLDLSEGGARVSASDYDLVPSRVFLVVEKTGDIFECEVKWRRADGLGFSFIDSPGRACRKVLLELCRAEPA